MGRTMTRAMLLEMLEAERSRVESGFLDGVVLDAYVDKLLQHSELLIRSQGGRCLGVLALYCNNWRSRKAFISLLVVSPEARGRGIAVDLLNQACRTVRARDFLCLGIEVSPENRAALACYSRFGFSSCGIRNGLISMEMLMLHDQSVLGSRSGPDLGAQGLGSSGELLQTVAQGVSE
ncbi:GNAT family N-acetyltransferase [Halomonas mongoliensis]|uniref:GNAT family N-acetyltransferase n=2 Tax=Halomonas mongoliensis TaxID=321265 RepID=UPI00403ABE77